MHKLIVIDPGHGGRDPGAQVGKVREKELVIPYSLALAEELRKRGYSINMTRQTDVDLAPKTKDWRIGKGQDLRARSDLANKSGAELFVSMHCNASASNKVNGAWVLYSKGSTRGQKIAALIFREMAKVKGIADSDPEAEVYSDDTGWTGGRTLSVLRRTNMPAVLVELGFLTETADLKQLQDVETIPQVAKAIADGIDAANKVGLF